ncbi:hypothetical protein R3P38DRAFT_2768730 [Favolaschia claudopus]|uniref:Uncharacterized protein n=1 Tax=Favolaschia claudopus TaxID=2862362 RepID=A0AAW0CPD3_9AGAR
MIDDDGNAKQANTSRSSSSSRSSTTTTAARHSATTGKPSNVFEIRADTAFTPASSFSSAQERNFPMLSDAVDYTFECILPSLGKNEELTDTSIAPPVFRPSPPLHFVFRLRQHLEPTALRPSQLRRILHFAFNGKEENEGNVGLGRKAVETDPLQALQARSTPAFSSLPALVAAFQLRFVRPTLSFQNIIAAQLAVTNRSTSAARGRWWNSTVFLSLGFRSTSISAFFDLVPATICASIAPRGWLCSHSTCSHFFSRLPLTARLAELFNIAFKVSHYLERAIAVAGSTALYFDIERRFLSHMARVSHYTAHPDFQFYSVLADRRSDQLEFDADR